MVICTVVIGNCRNIFGVLSAEYSHSDWQAGSASQHLGDLLVADSIGRQLADGTPEQLLEGRLLVRRRWQAQLHMFRRRPRESIRFGILDTISVTHVIGVKVYEERTDLAQYLIT